MILHNAITDVPGIEVGQVTDLEALTGCTVILCRAGAVCGVDVRGGGPGTRETDLLDPVSLVQQIHAVLLSGGSAFGLDAAGGVMRYLEEQGIGYDIGIARVPIVPAAILLDLGLGSSKVRPDAEMGYRAAAAANAGPVAEGNVGAGTGATSGKFLGMANAMKTGLGTVSLELGGGVIVGALAAVNPGGNVIDPRTGEIIAGARSPSPQQEGGEKTGETGGAGYFADIDALMKRNITHGLRRPLPHSNTVLGVVATNARLDKPGATKVAQMAHDGLARTVHPAHTQRDGDTIFALSTGDITADVSIVGAFAADAMAEAILRAARLAESAGGLPGYASLKRGSS
jgi:L-aminopeptidase/D-esterase-like protein